MKISWKQRKRLALDNNQHHRWRNHRRRGVMAHGIGVTLSSGSALARIMAAGMA